MKFELLVLVPFVCIGCTAGHAATKTKPAKEALDLDDLSRDLTKDGEKLPPVEIYHSYGGDGSMNKSEGVQGTVEVYPSSHFLQFRTYDTHDLISTHYDKLTIKGYCSVSGPDTAENYPPETQRSESNDQ